MFVRLSLLSSYFEVFDSLLGADAVNMSLLSLCESLLTKLLLLAGPMSLIDHVFDYDESCIFFNFVRLRGWFQVHFGLHH